MLLGDGLARLRADLVQKTRERLAGVVGARAARKLRTSSKLCGAVTEPPQVVAGEQGERFLEGGPRWTVNALAERLMVPAKVLNEVVSILEAQGLVLTAEDDTIAPGRDLSAIRLTAILDAVRHEVPNPRCPPPRSVAAADAASQAIEQAMRDALGERTLRDLLVTESPRESATSSQPEDVAMTPALRHL